MILHMFIINANTFSGFNNITRNFLPIHPYKYMVFTDADVMRIHIMKNFRVEFINYFNC